MDSEGAARSDAAESERRYAEFVALLTRCEPGVRRFIRSLLPSGSDLDDIVQETALECWRKYEGFRVPDGEERGAAFLRWACVIARFKVMSRQRDRGRDRLVFRAEVVEKLADDVMESADMWQQYGGALRECLARLTEDQQRLVLAVHTPGESVARIAAEAGIVPRRLYTRVNALRRRLRACIEARMLGGAGYE